jgi:hypothetical protein
LWVQVFKNMISIIPKNGSYLKKEDEAKENK